MKSFLHTGLGVISFGLASANLLGSSILAVLVQTAVMFVSMVAIGGTVVGLVNLAVRVFKLTREQSYYVSWAIAGIVGMILVASLYWNDGSVFGDQVTWVESLTVCFAVVVSTDRHYSYYRRKHKTT